jgi:hypothetical protein
MTYRFRTKPWPEIARLYEDFVHQHAWPFQPMLELVQFIASSRYSSSLFACTSHDLLHIGRVADFTPGDNELQVKFNGSTQRFLFTYVQRPDDASPWSRECEASAWREVLERLLNKRLRWFGES